MSEVTNTTRAGWARTALEAYIGETRHGGGYELTLDNSENNEEVIGDFLCDLRHLCDDLGLDFEVLAERGAMHHREEIAERLEYLRGELEAERISTGELIELQSLAPHIEEGDVQLLEAAGVPEFPKETVTDEIMELLTPDPWGQAEAADARKRHAAGEFVPGQHVKLLNTHEGDGGWSTAYIESESCGVYAVRVQGHSLYRVTADKLERLEGQ